VSVRAFVVAAFCFVLGGMEWFDCRARLRLFLLNTFCSFPEGVEKVVLKQYRRLPNCTVVTFRNVRRKTSPAQVWIKSTYRRKSIRNPNCNTLRPDRLKHDRPVNCVIAQQYSSANFLVRFCSRKRKLCVCLKNVIIYSFYVFFFCTSEFA